MGGDGVALPVVGQLYLVEEFCEVLVPAGTEELSRRVQKGRVFG